MVAGKRAAIVKFPNSRGEMSAKGNVEVATMEKRNGSSV